MAVRIKSGGGKRYVDNAATATDSYVAGAQNPRQDWQKATQAGEVNWKLGINSAIAKGSFGKGVAKAGNAAWLDGVVNKGAQRFASGVALAQTKYENGIKDYLDTISGLNLPPRGPKGDPNNIARVTMIAKALHDKKLSKKG